MLKPNNNIDLRHLVDGKKDALLLLLTPKFFERKNGGFQRYWYF
jgi:hypothetical protein